MVTMTAQTKTRHKVGTTEYEAHVRWVIPLDDPEAEGNGGLQGFDEDSEYCGEFKSKAAALAWVKRNVLSHYVRQYHVADIREVTWEAEDYEDDKYGRIYGACERITRQWDYSIADDGTVQEDGDWCPDV